MDTYVRNPGSASSLKAALGVFTVKVGHPALKAGPVDSLEGVDVDHSVEMIVDLTGNDWNSAASGTDEELRSTSTESVWRHE
jgi:hypothetical protein